MSRKPGAIQVIRWLTKVEEIILLAACPEWLRDIVIFAIYTGMRQGEIVRLEWKDVDLFRKEACVLQSKNYKPRTIRLNKKVMEVLKRKKSLQSLNSPRVFLDADGLEIDPSKLRGMFRRIVKGCSIQHCRFHDLRHTFGTRLAQAGISVPKIAKFMGHRNISTTMRYIHLTTESLQDCVEVLDNDYGLTTLENDECA